MNLQKRDSIAKLEEAQSAEFQKIRELRSSQQHIENEKVSLQDQLAKQSLNNQKLNHNLQKLSLHQQKLTKDKKELQDEVMRQKVMISQLEQTNSTEKQKCQKLKSIQQEIENDKTSLLEEISQQSKEIQNLEYEIQKEIQAKENLSKANLRVKNSHRSLQKNFDILQQKFDFLEIKDVNSLVSLFQRLSLIIYDQEIPFNMDQFLAITQKIASGVEGLKGSLNWDQFLDQTSTTNHLLSDSNQQNSKLRAIISHLKEELEVYRENLKSRQDREYSRSLSQIIP